MFPLEVETHFLLLFVFVFFLTYIFHFFTHHYSEDRKIKALEYRIQELENILKHSEKENEM
ncbi:MAG: hypothetical protein ACXAC7_13235 [Candidatus Hodarchaeales archaeon]|jgi:hypothetical protein